MLSGVWLPDGAGRRECVTRSSADSRDGGRTMQNLWSTLSKPFSRDQDHQTFKAHTGHVWCLAITDQTVFSGAPQHPSRRAAAADAERRRCAQGQAHS